MRITKPSRLLRLSCLSMSAAMAVSMVAPLGHAFPVQDQAEAAAQESDDLPSAVEFRELAQKDPEKAAGMLDQLIEADVSYVPMAISIVATPAMQKRDYDTVAATFHKGFEHYFAKLEKAEASDAQAATAAISMARMVSVYGSRSESMKEKAGEPLEKVSALLKERYEATPNSAEATAAYLQVVSATSTPDEAAEMVTAAYEKFPESLQIAQSYFNLKGAQASAKVNSDPKAASEMIAALKEELESNEALADASKTQINRLIASVEGRVAPALARMELIGKPAPLFDAEAWVNGDAATLRDLRGKVVLLDFWAVWCGPCIATFPHLREWNEEYGEKGLVIVGVTSKYNYQWDDDAERAMRVAEADEHTMDAEIQMLEKFLAHHELEHRSMVTPADTQMKKEYGVTGIPQAVLIDKDGNVRMIRVGSGQANADALHEMIEELLDE